MELQLFKIENLPAGIQIIFDQSNFINTVEDVAECLVRHMGNDSDLDSLATNYAFRLSAGHSLIILIKEAFPINVLPRLKEVPEIVTIYCATANPIEIIYVQTEMGRAIIGIVDGFSSKDIEKEEDIIERQKLLRKIGYKF